MKSLTRPFTILILIAGVFSCTHEPFPAPPSGMGNDTIQNPNDTISNPNDTLNNSKPCDPDTVYYLRDIQPILTANCAMSGCHDAVTQQDGIRLTDYNSVASTADVRPFNPGGSDLYEVISESDPDKRMPPPPASPLSAAEIALIRKWIEQGAKDLHCDECDTTNLTYTANIQAIFTSCTGCHGATNPSANLSLTTYQQVKDAMVGPYDLILRINGGDANNPQMPQGGMLSSCNIKKIETWYNNGMPQ